MGYLLEGGKGGRGASGGGGVEELGLPAGCERKSPDWLYESYYRMSQQHPLIVFLLLIVMGACVALIAVFFASGLVRVHCPSLFISFFLFLDVVPH